jgi:transposase
MEATGVYWKPVWHILDGRFALILANAAHVKTVPGRKSDVNDASWLADLLAHGLIRPSFVPPAAIQDLRDLTRTRKQLTREIAQHSQRIQAVLEEANVKLCSVITDILGASGRRMLKAMIAGEIHAYKLAALGSERLGCAPQTLIDALTGHMREHHRFLLAQHLQTIEFSYGRDDLLVDGRREGLTISLCRSPPQQMDADSADDDGGEHETGNGGEFQFAFGFFGSAFYRRGAS